MSKLSVPIPKFPQVRLKPAAIPVAPSGEPGRFAFYAALMLILVVFSRSVEYPGLRSLKLGGIAFGLCLLVLPFSGGLRRVLRDKITWLFLGLSVWLALSSLFGMWMGGSVDILATYWSRSLLTYAVFAGAVAIFGQVETMLRMWTLAMAMMCAYAQIFGTLVEGRLTLESGFFSNPNDLAAIIVISLPISWYVVGRSSNIVSKLGWLALTLVMWLVFFRTGSRGGFIGIAVIMFSYFLMIPFLYKLRLLVVGILLLITAGLILPDATARRFVTFSRDFSLAEVEEGKDIYAYGSTDSRIEMAEQGVMFTVRHPLFGLGPGNFKVASADYFKARGIKPAWTDVHNTYLQFSSENGIMALILYLTVIVSCFRRLSRVAATARAMANHQGQHVLDMANHLRLCLIGYIVSAVFGNYAYLYHFFILSGFIVALYSVVPAPAAVRVPAPLAPAVRTPRFA